MQWLAFLMIGLSAACTGPNPAYEAFSIGAPAPDAAVRADGGLADRAGDAQGPNGRLMGYWRFDEQSGATTAADGSGYGNDGVVESMDSSRIWVAGHSGNAIQFLSGADPGAGVRVPLAPSLAGIRQFTVGAWIYRSAVPTNQNTSVISRQLGAQFWEIYNVSAINEELVVYAATDVSPAPAVRIAGAAPVGVWIHVAATYDGATLRLFGNGQLLGSTPLTRALPTDTSPLYIGTNKNPQRNDVFIGLIDEVVLYSVALSDAAVAQLAAGAPPGSL